MTATRILSLFHDHVSRVASLLCVLAVIGTGPVFADDAPQRDLQGILPEFLPNGLSEADFNELKDNWSEWAAETGRLVGDLYLSDNDDVRGRRATLERLRIKLITMEKALNDPQYLSIYGTLADLNGRLSRRIALAEALLATVEQDVTATAQAQFSASLNDLAGTANALRAHLGGIAGGEKWIDYFRLNEVVAAAGAGDSSGPTVELLMGVQGKLDGRTELAEEQRAFLSREPVLRFEDALGHALSMLDVNDPDGYRQHLRDLAADLMIVIEDYEGEPTAEHMQSIRNTYDDIRRSAPDGGAVLTDAMRRYYLNFNLRLVMDETLIQDLLHDTRMESGYINEMVSGAKVTGCQMTNTTVNVDLKPSDTGVKLDLNLMGTVRSSAQGETHVATVYTTGRHYFNARKTIHFDGDHFKHWCAVVTVGGAACPYAAQTCLSWAPLLGNAAENLVLKVANDKAPDANAQALTKIRTEVQSQFDRETSQMLREAELGIEEKVTGPLREGGYYPDIKEFRSTETELLIRTRLMEAGEIGGTEMLPMPVYPTHGVLVQLHESLLNQVGDRLDLDGKRFTPEQLDAYLKTELQAFLGQGIEIDLASQANKDPNSPKVEQIIFHEADAIRFQIRGGEVIIILSMGLKLEDREEIPPQRITVPLNFTLAGDKMAMQRGTVGISPIGNVPPRERAQQIARAGVMRSKIQEAFEPQEFDSIFTLDAGEKTVTLKITQLQAHGSWLSIIATDGIGKDGQPKTNDTRPVPQANGQPATRTR